MGADAIAAKPGDHRFANPAWQTAPFGLMAQAVLLGEEWWASLVQSPAGVDLHNARIVAFTVRQWLDMMSPSNVPWLNPQVIAATKASNGANLANGMRNLLRDQATVQGHPAPSPGLVVGVDIAATPGKVVFRNALIELT